MNNRPLTLCSIEIIHLVISNPVSSSKSNMDVLGMFLKDNIICES